MFELRMYIEEAIPWSPAISILKNWLSRGANWKCDQNRLHPDEKNAGELPDVSYGQTLRC